MAAPEHCEACNGPVFRAGLLALAFYWVCFRAWMILPDRIAHSKAGYAVLAQGGSYLHACSCWRKTRRASATRFAA